MPKVETMGLSRVSPENNRVLLATLVLPAPSACTADLTCMLAFLALRSSAKSGVKVAVKPTSEVTKSLNPPPMTLMSDCSSTALRGSEYVPVIWAVSNCLPWALKFRLEALSAMLGALESRVKTSSLIPDWLPATSVCCT